jgi:predicted component of type VI protein secretion system
MKIKIIFVIVAVIFMALGGISGSIITKKMDTKNFTKIEKIYQTQYQEVRSDYKELAAKARYMISQTLTIKKNKKGQVIYVPSSTMEIDKVIESIDENISVPIDSIIQDSVKVTFFDKLKNLFK